jgi:uncharacterized protein
VRRLLLIALFLWLGHAPLVFAQAVSAPPLVVTQGEATVKRAADRAWLSIATETRESRAADARRRGAEAMTAVQAALRSAGVSQEAIRTTGYGLVPEMDWNNGRGTVRGYLVRNEIEVRVDELDKIGDVIDAANSAKSTAISVTGPRFGLKDESAVENEALRAAVQAALVRAQSMATGARRALGAIVRIEEQRLGGVRPEPLMMRSALGVAAETVQTPIVPGDIEIRAVVTVTVELR